MSAERERVAGFGRLEDGLLLLDTGVFDGDRYWITEVVYAKAGPDDLLMAIQVTNAGPEADTIHVLPTAGSATPGPGTPPSRGGDAGIWRPVGHYRPPVSRHPGTHRRHRA